ncbi:unnamed protein product [Amoebophrya sp. A120]|nr:unnamed protein product [Amoebophrya sp. A120]|eukprot:GSA120T00011069001.1
MLCCFLTRYCLLLDCPFLLPPLACAPVDFELYPFILLLPSKSVLFTFATFVALVADPALSQGFVFSALPAGLPGGARQSLGILALDVHQRVAGGTLHNFSYYTPAVRRPTSC